MPVLDVNSTTEGSRVGGQLKLATNVGIFTDTNVAASNTKAALLAVVAAAVLPIGSSETIRTQTIKAINVGFDLGLLSDALIAPLTTAAGLIALTGVPTSYGARAFYE